MKINLNDKIGQSYNSNSQIIRVITEQWVENEIFCPNCGNHLIKFEDNRPVADFFCKKCEEEYELKSKKDSLGNKIVDGAYKTMIKRLESNNNPNFFFLNYSLDNYKIINFLIIPKHFFVPEIIEKRKPLSKNAKRSGWVGCNILLKGIPEGGKIFYIKNSKVEPRENILFNWQKTLFLRDKKIQKSKGWVLDIISCIENLQKLEFSLQEIYAFEDALKIKYPNNNFIKEKIRQQLQFLRDKNYLEFVNKGRYRLIIQ